MVRPLKAGALALGIVGLLLLVAMAARGGHPNASGHVATRSVPDTLQDSFVTLLAIAYAVALVAVLVGFFAYKTKFHDPDSSWLKNYLLVLALMTVVTGIGYFVIAHTDLRKRGERAQAALTGTSTNRNGGRGVESVPTRQAHFQWPLALGVVGLVLLGGVWVYVQRRRELVAREPDSSLEADMVATIETTIEDLRSERDARKAVIAAYASMERTLTLHGLQRHPAEAPTEYLARILRSLDVRESAVRSLTELFEYAKFSPHAIDAAMKEQAIDALLAVRDDLQREEVLAA